MGFVIDGREIKVTADGLIHLVSLVVGALGVSGESAAEEIRGMVARGDFPDVRCFMRGPDVLVTSGAAEAVLSRLVKSGKVLRGSVVMGMRCFMSQNGPFAPRIREGTTPVLVAEVCAGPVGECQWAEEPPSNSEWSGRLMGGTEWANDLFIERDEEIQGKPPAEAGLPPLARHRTRLTDLELDQIEGATELRALEGQREHYARVYEWYHQLCTDTVIDDRAKEVFKRVLVDMLPACGRSWTDRHTREAWRKDIHESLS